MTVDLDRVLIGAQRLNLDDSTVVDELRRLFWAEEAREIATQVGLPTDDEFLAKFAGDLQKEGL